MLNLLKVLKQYCLLVIVLLLLLILSLADTLYPLVLPEQNKLFARVVVDDLNRPLRTFADDKGVWRYPVRLHQVSPLYIEALLTYEDRWFWQHPGFNPVAIVRAALINLRNGRVVAGGSTITMQVARLLHPHKKSFTGKLQQLLRSLQLEWHLDKTQILELYLNIAPFGGTTEGVQAASFSYLNKSSLRLSHAEAALLAVLPQAPSRYRPDLHPQAAAAARDKVLQRMLDLSVWSAEDIAGAKQEAVYSQGWQRHSFAPLLSRRLLKNSDGQAAIYTTIDGDLQQNLEEYLRNTIPGLPPKSSAAILVVENKTAAVKAYLGSADFNDSQRFAHVDMVQAIRSPGSTLKPLLFSLSLDAGLIHSHSLMVDVPRSWGSYRPGNFSGGFAGPVAAADALQRSLNIPFVDLLERYGPGKFHSKLAGAGLPLRLPGGKPNLAMILGGTGTSLEQLVTAYRAMAMAGKTRPLAFTQQQLKAARAERYLMSAGSAWITQQVLAGVARPDAIHTLAAQQSQQGLAWKTGTSYGFRDVWAIGFSPEYTIGVWLGRPDGTPMPGHSGRKTAGPILFAVADHLRLRPKSKPMPESVSQQTICWPLGVKTVNPKHCYRRHQAWILDQVIPYTWHGADADNWQALAAKILIDRASGQRLNASCTDSFKVVEQELVYWPRVLEPWVKAEQRRGRLLPPLHHNCQRFNSPAVAKLNIIGISNGAKFYSPAADKSPKLSLQAIGGIGRYHWYINGKRIYSGRAIVSHRLNKKGLVQIAVVDAEGNVDQRQIVVL